MAIDPRIALAGTDVNASQAINIFENALTNAQNRDIARSQENRTAELFPLQKSTAESNLATAQSQQRTARNTAKLENITGFAVQLKPALDRAVVSGDSSEVESILTERAAQLQQDQLQGGDIDANDTLEALQQVRSGDVVGLQNTVNDAVNLRPQLGLGGGPSGVQSSQFIPGVGFATLSKTGEASVVPVAGVGETAEEKRAADIDKSAQIEQQKARLQGKSAAVKQAVVKGGQAFDKIQPLSTAINNYDEAIAALDSGADTGVVTSLFPSFKKASIELDNVVKRLGIDVVGNTTFGALSESELAFALKAAIPTGLRPPDLKEWLIAKRDAQRKVKERVEEAASFLSSGTNTIKDWIEFDAARQINQKNQKNDVVQQPISNQPSAQVLRFDSQGNQIQ